MKKLFIFSAFLLLLSSGLIFDVATKAHAATYCYPPQSDCEFCNCSSLVENCRNFCLCISNKETGDASKPETSIGHVTFEFERHRQWFEQIFFGDTTENDAPGLLASLELMAHQLTLTSMQQVQVIGTFFDAKHQLETQRLFQTLTARAHKDYHPSEGLCEFGTFARSLSASAENSYLSSAAISRHSISRQLLAKDGISGKAVDGDQQNRLVQFVHNYCNKDDNAGMDEKGNVRNLNTLCKKSKNQSHLFNKDINYTDTVSLPLTLDVDFSATNPASTEDEEAVLALSSNLFAHNLFPFVSDHKFLDPNKNPDFQATAQTYLDARALVAKRSVAQNSLASIIALKTKGDPNATPFIYSLLKEMGMQGTMIEKEIGENPSYFAQMEVLTKKIYQNPEFYSDLYDKPANVLRKEAAILAATLMQKRDLYNSYLRSEMTLAVMLETALMKEQTIIEDKVRPLK